MDAILRGRRSAVASTAILSLAAGSLVALAVVSRGQVSTNVSLNDAGVWVTGTSEGVLGLFNAEIRQSVIGLVPHSQQFDVLQDGSTVLLNDVGGARIRAVDVASAAFTGVGAGVPTDSRVAMGGRIVAVLDPTGSLWIRDASDASAGEYDGDADYDLGAGAAVAVGRDGTVYAASLKQQRLLSIPPGSVGARPKSTSLPKDAGSVAVTVVGDEPVVLLGGGRIQLPNGNLARLPEDPGAQVALQQVGDAADTALVATNKALYAVDLNGGAVSSIVAEGGTGDPAAPVRLGRCSYGAWGKRPTLLTACDGSDASVAAVGAATPAKLVFRVNRGRIVLNDVANGQTFLLDDPREQLADWKSARLREDEADQDPNKTSSSDNSEIKLEDRNRPNRPPTAVRDTFGVRPGRTVVLPVLANDGDPDGDVLRVSQLTTVPESAIGQAQIIENGKAIEFVAVPGATGTASFEYVVDDGRTGTATARVTVPVVPDEANSPPRPLSASATSSTAVVRGGRVVHNVLKDWVDPDGDPLLLMCPPAKAGVVCSPDGPVTYQDSRRQTGFEQLQLEVSDGREEARSVLDINVVAPGAQPPLARSDYVHAFVGRTVVALPLENDTTFAREPVRLAKIEGSVPTVHVVPDTEDGSINLTPSVPGTYYLTYQIATGPQSAFGIVRIDVTKPGGPEAPIAAPDSALVRPDQPALVDVLANDVDPGGNVLVVADVRSSSPELTIEVLDRQLVRVSAEPGFEGPANVSYSVNAGAKSASSFLLVRRKPDGTPNQPPVAKDDRVVARVGQPVYVGVLDNDADPEAGQLELEQALVGVDSAFRPSGLAAGEASGPVEAFVSDDQVRLLAPSEPGLVSLGYSVIDPEGQATTASITVQVIGHDSPNRPPTPKPVEARVLAGRTVTVDIPLPGIDPDGDPVKLEPVDSPAKGTLAITKDNRLAFTAGPEAGTFEFRYQVTDPGGLSGQATVLVGVAPPSLTPRPPVAINDSARIRNDRDRIISIPVMANDSDPDGDTLTLAPTLTSPAGISAKVSGEYVAVSVPKGSTDQMTMGYSISSAGGTDDALVSVTGSPTAPLEPPTAVDDFPTAAGFGATIDVPVLANDTNATGPPAELEVSTEPGAVGPVGVAARLNAKTVRVTRTDRDQWATYTINDADGGEAKAFIFVPRNDNQAPRPVDPLPLFEVQSGAARQLSIADFAVDPEGSRVELTTTDAISSSGVAVSNVSRTGFTVRPTIPSGKASLTFEVMDGANGSDPNVRKGKITIVVVVLPVDEVPPVFATQRISVEYKSPKPATLNLENFTTAGPNDAGRFSYKQLNGRIAGLGASLSGPRGTILTVSAAGAPVGTRTSLTFTVALGKVSSIGRVDVDVVQTRKPPPRATDCSVGGASAGSTFTVDLTRCTVNPFPEVALVVTPETWRSQAGSATARGLTVSVSVPSGFSGSGRVPYTVQDKLGRTASANIVFSVLGRAGPPGQPEIVTPLPGGGTAVLTWTAADPNGGTIDYYTVRDPSNGYSQRCPGAVTRCVITGIDYEKPYTFTVTAHTIERGDGQPSAPVTLSGGAAARHSMGNLDANAGDGRATLTWTGTFSGTPITSYVVTLRPAPSSGAGVFTIPAPSGSSPQRVSLTVTDLRNGTDYSYTVAAMTKDGEKTFETTSGIFTPAGPVTQPAAPTAVATGGLRGGQVTVSWDPANIAAVVNGRLTSLKIMQGGSQQAAIEATAALNAGRMVIEGLDTRGTYSFALQVTNGGGFTATSTSNSATVEGKPGTPAFGTPVAGDGQATLPFVLGAVNGTGYRSITLAVANRTRGGTRNVAVPVVAGQSSYAPVVSSLVNGETYAFSVTACNTSLCSDSAEAPGTVVPFGVPEAPQPTVTVVRQRVTFSWENPDFNGAAGVLGIAITGAGYPTGACPTQTVGAGTCSFTGSWNTAYTLVVTARTAGGTDSNSVMGTVAPAAKPVAPRIRGTSSGQTVTFAWSAPNFDGLPGTMTIDVTGEGYAGGCPTTDSGSGACSFTGDWNTAYTILITVVSEGGTDTATATTRVMPAPQPVAPQPTGSASGPVVRFDWGPPNFNGLPGTMSIEVTGSGYPGGCPDSSSGAGSCSFIGNWNTAYQMTITVRTAGGTDAKSATVSVGGPPEPVAPQPSGSTSGRLVQFSWGDPDYQGLPGTMSISVTGDGYPGGCPTSASGSGSCAFTGDYNTSYRMVIRVDTAGGSDRKSATTTVGPPPAPKAPKPQGSASGLQVTFSWGAPDYNGLPGTMTISVSGAGYPDGACQPSASGGAGSCTFDGNYSTTYTMTIQVETAGGTDTASDSVTTDDPPPLPTVTVPPLP